MPISLNKQVCLFLVSVSLLAMACNENNQPTPAPTSSNSEIESTAKNQTKSTPPSSSEIIPTPTNSPAPVPIILTEPTPVPVPTINQNLVAYPTSIPTATPTRTVIFAPTPHPTATVVSPIPTIELSKRRSKIPLPFFVPPTDFTASVLEERFTESVESAFAKALKTEFEAHTEKMGISVAVYKAGKGWTGTAGLANPETPMTADTP